MPELSLRRLVDGLPVQAVLHQQLAEVVRARRVLDQGGAIHGLDDRVLGQLVRGVLRQPGRHQTQSQHGGGQRGERHAVVTSHELGP